MSTKTDQTQESFKNVQIDLKKMRNRIEKLKKKSRYQKVSIERHKSLAQRVLSEKISLAQKLAQRNRDQQQKISMEKQNLEHLKIRNARRRSAQKQEISNIMKAIYLVKVDDAREMKRLSKEHKDNLRKINSSLVEEKRKRIDSIKSEEGEKERQYWKQKLYRLYLENEAGKEGKKGQVLEKKEELEKLKKEEEKMMLYYNKIQGLSEQSKKEYTSAVSVPLKHVASMLENKKQKLKPRQVEQSRILYKRAKQYGEENEEETNMEEEHHFPKTQVNQAKLKIVLERLKKKKEEEKIKE